MRLSASELRFLRVAVRDNDGKGIHGQSRALAVDRAGRL